MAGSWKLGRFVGIDVHIHWSFWLLMLFYTLSATLAGGLTSGLMTALFVALVFACVLAHEFGHALAAAGYGIPTRDITLLPIGGLARLERMPEDPKQELVIALAGPLVNVVIAAALIFSQWLSGLAVTTSPEAIADEGLLAPLVAANIVLVLFNMLPAFPMDGGRVLRSLIAMRTTHLRATEIAARVGRWMALLFFMIGLMTGQFTLVLVSIFVFMAGMGELLAARGRAMAAAGGAAPFTWAWSVQRDPFGGGYDSSRGYEAYDRPMDRQAERSPDRLRAHDQVIDALDVREIKP